MIIERDEKFKILDGVSKKPSKTIRLYHAQKIRG